MTAINNDAMFAVIAQATDETLREQMLGNLATVRRVDVSVISAEFDTFVENNKAKVEAERKATAIAVLTKEAEDMDLESDSLADFVERVQAEGGHVFLTVEEGEVGIEVSLKAPKSGGSRGGGKPPAWKPSDYRDSAGDRIVGPLTTWVNDNLTEAERQAAGVYRPNGKLRTGKALGVALAKAGVATKDPATAEEIEAARKASDSK